MKRVPVAARNPARESSLVDRFFLPAPGDGLPQSAQSFPVAVSDANNAVATLPDLLLGVTTGPELPATTCAADGQRIASMD